jgi:hypothetical protein
MGNAWDDVFDELDEAKPAEAWKPENAGDSIAGIVDSIGEFTNEYGTVPTVTLTQRDGSAKIVYGFSGALKKRLTDANLKPGDGIKIAYLGIGEMDYKGKKTPFKKFEVAVKRNMAGALAGVQMGGEPMPTDGPKKDSDGFGDEAF